MECLNLLISYLKNETNFDEPICFEKIFSICKLHNILPILYASLKKYKIQFPIELKKKIDAAYKNAMYQEVVRSAELNEILNCFEEHNVKCMPLKGAILKNLYPSPELRTMCDIDILYDNSKKIKNIMSTLGYKLAHTSNHHDVYEKPPFMNVEMHHHLISEDFNIIREYYDNIWSVVSPINDNSSIYEMTLEDFYVFMISHIAKHFQFGGIGIRYVFDEYIFLEKYNKILDFEYIEHELSKIHLLKFERNFKTLMKIWFHKEPSNEFYDEMSAYILESSVHGTSKHVQMLNMAIGTNGQKVLKSNKLKYLLNRLFPTFTQMKYRYSILKKLPILLPICYIERLIMGLFVKRRQTLYEVTGMKKFNTDKAVKIQSMNKEMEFKNQK